MATDRQTNEQMDRTNAYGALIIHVVASIWLQLQNILSSDT